MPGLFEQVQEAKAHIHSRWGKTPVAGIVLGTGLGGLAADIDADVKIPYGEIPHFLSSTAPSHKGQLVCGTLADKPVVAMEGRFHFYEGYDLGRITFPVRAIRALGADVLVVSNACGGLNPQWDRGDIMLLDDPINLLGANTLVGANDEPLRARLPATGDTL